MARPKKLADTKAVIVHLFPDDYYAVRAILLKQGKSFSSFVREATWQLTKGKNSRCSTSN